MRALLMAGLGPTYKNFDYLSGSLFDEVRTPHASAALERAAMGGLELGQLSFRHAGKQYPLLRPRRSTMPHLTTFTLEAILQANSRDYGLVSLEDVWEDQAIVPPGDFDVVLLSTTYIWNKATMQKAVAWVGKNLGTVPIVAGGQYSNLKYMQILRDHPTVVAVVRGDGEAAIPALLDRLDRPAHLGEVPNLVWRDMGRIRINGLEYIDIDSWPSPAFDSDYPVVPYESMRGCPFDCKFCSFPMASPKWRYKSAEKIRDDWMRYAEINNASFIEAMDSTFTVPPTRLRRLFEILPAAGVAWEGYSRANVVNTAEFVDNLVAAHCRRLQIGFESMSDAVLKRMSKRVNVAQNRRAFELLSQSDLGYTIFFMTGYPGETPEQFAETENFLLKEYVGHYMLSVFSVSDETMPLWDDREELALTIADPEEPDADWSHVGMDIATARALNQTALDRVRLQSDTAVTMLWQGQFQHWFMPQAPRRVNLQVEKAVERLAMAPKDFASLEDCAHQMRTQVERLAEHGVVPMPTHLLTDGQVEGSHAV